MRVREAEATQTAGERERGRGTPSSPAPEPDSPSPAGRAGCVSPGGYGWNGVRVYARRHHDLIWLIYTVFFFIEPIQRNSLSYWIEFALAYLAFLALYAGTLYARSRRQGYLLLAAMGLLGLLYYPVNQGASGIFIYVTALAPFLTESIPVTLVIFAATVAAVVGEGIILHMSLWTWVFPVFMGLAVGAGNLMVTQRMRANRRLGLAHEEIEHLARVAERERIARDLHDVLGHTLSVVVLKSELAGKLLGRDPERARREIAEVEQIARSALAEVREAIQGYRSEGLGAELVRARATLDAAGVALELASPPPRMAPAEETVLSLIVREAVTNIVRHSGASRCRITLDRDGAGTRLRVEDDGRGCIRGEGSGLRGMRERAEALGGSLAILCEGGTRIEVAIPAQI